MLLVVDVGNTEVTLGLFRGDTLAGQWRLATRSDRTPDEWAAAVTEALALEGQAAGAIAAACLTSVAPAVTPDISRGLRRLTGRDPAQVDATTPLPVVLDVEEPLTVGGDRIVNTLAGAALFATDLVVVDFGTATTFDCITAEGRFIGGAIAPGLRTSADQLTQKAAKLPATELRPPARAIGRRTEECIQAGVLFGAADAADGMLRRIRAEWPGGGRPRAVATGGLAGLVAPLSTAIEEVVPDLTLQGLRLAAGHLGLRW
jgi:type III pantothenate kinase